MIDGLNGLSYQNFMLHYNFPPYSVGEVGRFGPPGRREVGHGKLAWRALRAVLPAKEDFPYRSEEHTSELQSLMRISYAVFCLKKKNTTKRHEKIRYDTIINRHTNEQIL